MTRIPGGFWDYISSDPDSQFPAGPGRYVLYVTPGCPWAHRTLIARHLKGLERFIDVFMLHHIPGPEGWQFTGTDGSLEKDPLHKWYTTLREIYLHANPAYAGPYTTPVLWDKKRDTIVNNESSMIIRMFYSEFDHLLPEHRREAGKPGGGLLPNHLRAEIDEHNEWVYNGLSNAVYLAGLSKTQQGYEEGRQKVFDTLDRLEQHLGHGQRYLLGDYITDADIRLFPTVVRFDEALHTSFALNLKSIRHDYPRLHRWLRVLYWDRDANGEAKGAFYDTTEPYFTKYREGYAAARQRIVLNDQGPLIVPVGPLLPVEQLTED